MLSRWCVLALLIPASAAAGEYAILSSGFRLHVERHEQTGDSVTLYAEGGKMELPASEISAFEHEEAVPQRAASPEAVEPPPAAPPSDPKALVSEAAKYAGLPEALVHSVARAESGYRPGAVSKKGALGVMQLMPSTAAAWNADPRDPSQNIYAGTLYLRDLLIRYNGQVSKALAAYNAGPGAVDKYHGVPPYAETRRYVNRVISDYVRLSQSAAPAQ
jgi:soluble lytic murein transglycosylase-like protein